MPRLSRRSLYLLLFGVLEVAYGLAVHDAAQGASLPIYGSVPMAWQGWAWVACGAVALATVAVPRAPRNLGFTAAVVPPALWALGFAALWLSDWTWCWFLPVPAGPEVAWQGALIWGMFAALGVVCSGDEDVTGR